MPTTTQFGKGNHRFFTLIFNYLGQIMSTGGESSNTVKWTFTDKGMITIHYVHNKL